MTVPSPPIPHTFDALQERLSEALERRLNAIPSYVYGYLAIIGAVIGFSIAVYQAATGLLKPHEIIGALIGITLAGALGGVFYPALLVFAIKWLADHLKVTGWILAAIMALKIIGILRYLLTH
jgi:hypothetical protein